MNENNRITVIIHTYNAEKFLQQVLNTVKDFDEIIVCDMHSSDRTIAIARANGCRVIFFDYQGGYAEPARDYAIHQARWPWVLEVDADELVTPELRNYLYHRISQPNCPQGLYIPRQNRIMNQPERNTPGDYQLRFFVRDGTVWPPNVHSFPVVKGRVEKITKQRQKLCLRHLAENYIADLVDKTNRYTNGELVKKAHKHYGVFALFERPLWRFFKSYVLGGKIRDGLPGFISSVMAAFYQFVLVAKFIEKKYRKDSESHS